MRASCSPRRCPQTCSPTWPPLRRPPSTLSAPRPLAQGAPQPLHSATPAPGGGSGRAIELLRRLRSTRPCSSCRVQRHAGEASRRVRPVQSPAAAARCVAATKSKTWCLPDSQLGRASTALARQRCTARCWAGRLAPPPLPPRPPAPPAGRRRRQRCASETAPAWRLDQRVGCGGRRCA